MKEDYSAFEYFNYGLEEVFNPEFTKSGTFNKSLKSTTGGTENAEYGKEEDLRVHRLNISS